MNRNAAASLVVLLPVLGAGLGYVAGPPLARTNATVRLAVRVWEEDRAGLAERTLASDAFRLTGGADRAVLFGKAEAIVGRFRVGGALLGLWCGLVVGLKALTLVAPARHTEFEVDHAWCVSCGRCYRWCPREHLRLRGGRVGSGTGFQPVIQGQDGRAASPAAGLARRASSQHTSVSMPQHRRVNSAARWRGAVGFFGRPWRGVAAALVLVTALFCAGIITGLAVTYARQARERVVDQSRLDDLKTRLAATPADEALRETIRREDLVLRRRYLADRAVFRRGAYLVLAGVIALMLSGQWYAGFTPRRPQVVARSGERSRHPQMPTPLRAHLRMRSPPLLGLGGVGAVLAAALAVLAAWRFAPLPPKDWEAVLAGPAPPEPVYRDAWTRFRGPAGMGLAGHGDWPLEWDAATGRNVLWKTPLPGDGKSSPLLWGNRVFLTAADMERRTLYVLCLDRTTGRTVWSKSLTPGFDDWTEAEREDFEVTEETGWAAPTPATDGERLYAAFATADVVCLDLDGNLLWRRNMGCPDNQYGLASSLLVHAGLVVWQLDQGAAAEDGLSALVAFSPTTGETAWRADRPVPNSWSTPIVAPLGAGEELVTAADPWVIAYDPGSGIELWRAKVLGGDVAPSPVAVEDVIYVTSDGGEAAAIRAGGSEDVTETNILWKVDEGLPDMASPLCDGKRFLQATGGGRVTCFEAGKGTLLWEHEFPCGFKASPTLANGLVYLPGDDGRTFVFELADEFRLRATNAVGEAVEATPAFGDGRIYIRGGKHLFCIGADGPQRRGAAETTGTTAE